MTLIRAYRAVANLPALLVASTLLVVSYLLVASGMQEVQATDVASARLLDLQFTYTPEYVARLMDDLGPEGRLAYVTMIVPDLLLPVALAVTLSLGIAMLLRAVRPSSRWDLLILVPFAAALFDYAENAMTLLGIATYPAPTWVAVLGSIGTTGKWTLLAASLIAVAVLVVVAVRAKVRQRTT